MKIGILSDIHDNRDNLQLALKKLKDVDLIFCLGDLCSPFIMRDLANGFDGEIHLVFGNNDGDIFRIRESADRYDRDGKRIHLHGEFADLTIGGKRFALNHFDRIAKAISRSDDYDVVCYGHTHISEISREGSTLVINPGEVLGAVHGGATCAIYDTEKDEALQIDIDE